MRFFKWKIPNIWYFSQILWKEFKHYIERKFINITIRKEKKQSSLLTFGYNQVLDFTNKFKLAQHLTHDSNFRWYGTKV